MDWNQLLRDVGVSVEHTVDDLRHRLQRKLGYLDPIHVCAYRGYGTENRVLLLGRVLEDDGISEALKDDTPWENLVRMFRRFETDEIPAARVGVTFDGQTFELESDREGYLSHTLTGSFKPGVLPVTYELLEPKKAGQQQSAWQGEVFIPSPHSEFIVVSDIDDTVLHTNATSLLKMAVTSLFSNEHKRIAFPGVAEFYQALKRGQGDHGGANAAGNPFFYLTSSMWNIYDMLRLFFELRGLPAGPLLMRDIGLTREHWLKSGHGEHKLKHLRQLLALYPDHRFVLLGDTGQKDAEIYREVALESPERLAAIYLRDVSDNARDDSVRQLARDVRECDVPICVAETSLEHARHAVEIGLIQPDALSMVESGGGDKPEAFTK